ncbi:VOC family protein [Paenibacillus arenosi]|uniref:VOC family protein n=1 Tax=Paenibacillus arenosi TaxID=2774142 RepID=A0ABR9AY60_9BACL|nr:VOC family protein [Paenibacillus arenosi]MBD8499023.1 VOC family protein [Paenibacillus arenosi]
MGRVVLFELNSQHPEQAAVFYSNVFGWKVTAQDWGYHSVATGADNHVGIDGGIVEGPADYPHGTRVTIEVECIDTAISRSVEQGAKVLRDKMEFDDFYLSYLVDPTGISFGLIQYMSKG